MEEDIKQYGSTVYIGIFPFKFPKFFIYLYT